MQEAARIPLVEAYSEAAVEAPSNPARYELEGDQQRRHDGGMTSEGGSSSPRSERTFVEG